MRGSKLALACLATAAAASGLWWAARQIDAPAFVLRDEIELPPGYKVGSLAYTAAEDRLVLVADQALHQALVFQPSRDPVLWPVPTEAPIGSAFALSPDEKRIAAPAGRSLKLFDVGTGRIEGSFAPGDVLDIPGSVAWSPDGKHVVFSDIHNHAHVGEAASGRVVKSFSSHGWAYGQAFSPDGSLLVSGNYDGVVNVWSTSSWDLLHSLRLGDKGRKEAVLALDFSRDGARLAVGGGESWGNSEHSVSFGSFKIWIVKDWTVEREVKLPEPVLSLSFSPEGEHLALTFYKSVHVWDLRTQREIWSTKPRFIGYTPAVVFGPMGTLALSQETMNGPARVQLWRRASPAGP